MLELAGSSVVDWVQGLATKASSCLSCLISGAFYVSIYFSRFFSSFQSFSLGRSDFKSSPDQFVSLRCWLKCKRQTILWPFFFLLICHPLCELIGNTPWNWSQKCEKAVCAAKCALTSATAVLAHFDPGFPVELSVDASPYGLGVDIMHVYSNGNRRPIAYASQTLNEHDKAFSYGIRFVPSKRNAVADALSRLPLPSAFNEEDATYRVEERLVHSLPITHKEIRYATRVDPVLSSALEFVKQGWAQHVEDLRLQPCSSLIWLPCKYLREG